MSREAMIIRCAYCNDADGPHIRVSAPQFSASGARPNVEFHVCERCDTKRQRAWTRYVRRMVADGH